MDLEELYQTIILEHSRRPRNKGPLEGATHAAAGHNPACGDEISVQVRIGPGGLIEAAGFTGQGCAISQAAASLLTLKLKGKSPKEALELLRKFVEMVKAPPGGGSAAASDEAGLGDLAAFAGVRKFPQRVKCATLAPNAFFEIFAGQQAEEG